MPWVRVRCFMPCRDREEKSGLIILEFLGPQYCQEHAVQAGYENFLGVFAPGGPLTSRFRQLLQFLAFGLQLLLGQEQPASWNPVQVVTSFTPSARDPFHWFSLPRQAQSCRGADTGASLSGILAVDPWPAA